MSPDDEITFAVITVSDTCAKDASKDRSGPRLVQLIQSSFKNAEIITKILPDERLLIQIELQKLIEQKNSPVSAIITTGGTGFAPRDHTPEATKPVLDKECPQLSMAIALASLQKTKFAALTRGLCGIAKNTLVLNFPGSEKAVIECFDVVRDLLPHALQLINNDSVLVRHVHEHLQSGKASVGESTSADNLSVSDTHVCPHKTGTGRDGDRNSPYPMITVTEALNTVFQHVTRRCDLEQFQAVACSVVNIPPFRASIKDGYAMKSTGFAGSKKVIGYIAAGDEENLTTMQEDECFKINTGAPLPREADCVIQIEDTKLLRSNKNSQEDLVEILVQPKANLDVRPIGCDLRKGDALFPKPDHSLVVTKSILASVGKKLQSCLNVKPRIAVVSTGSELLDPEQSEACGKIFDSNTTMLKSLLEQFGFDCASSTVLDDDFATVTERISNLFAQVDFVICSGGVSMGDKDYIKPVLKKLGFEIHYGRVNMKPGKPMTFASRGDKYFFGLPGNPVSAFVTFHLFTLPSLRWAAGWPRAKCELPKLNVILENKSVRLDARPEYMRATISSKAGQLYAQITGNQMSSRLQSIVGADVLLHLPARSDVKSCAVEGEILTASVLRQDFISKYF